MYIDVSLVETLDSSLEFLGYNRCNLKYQCNFDSPRQEMGNMATGSTTEVLADSSVGDCAPCAPGVSCPLVSEVDMAMHRYKK